MALAAIMPPSTALTGKVENTGFYLKHPAHIPTDYLALSFEGQPFLTRSKITAKLFIPTTVGLLGIAAPMGYDEVRLHAPDEKEWASDKGVRIVAHGKDKAPLYLNNPGGATDEWFITPVKWVVEMPLSFFEYKSMPKFTLELVEHHMATQRGYGIEYNQHTGKVTLTTNRTAFSEEWATRHSLPDPPILPFAGPDCATIRVIPSFDTITSLIVCNYRGRVLCLGAGLKWVDAKEVKHDTLVRWYKRPVGLSRRRDKVVPYAPMGSALTHRRSGAVGAAIPFMIVGCMLLFMCMVLYMSRGFSFYNDW